MSGSKAFSAKTLGLFASVAPDYFTHSGLEVLFLKYGIEEPENERAFSKQKRVLNALRYIQRLPNKQATQLLVDLIAELVPQRIVVERLMQDSQEMAFIESLRADGWINQDGMLRSSKIPTQDTPPVARIQMPSASVDVDMATSNRVFVVHGRDNALKESVARLLGQLGFDAVILHEQANQGRTIIEKFVEEAADAAYAVILLTPDDEGGLADSPNFRSRARQNVILELGYFVGLIGRNRVAALVHESVEVPSDLAGVAVISASNDSDDWKMKLAKEMRAVGLSVDLNRI
jgi:predicted nucleotide-binding protein